MERIVFLDRATLEANLRRPTFPHHWQEYASTSSGEILEYLKDVHAGLEYYGEYGPINHTQPSNERAQYLYGVADVEKNDFDINFGIGHGFHNASDRWVAKAIIVFPFK